MNPAFRLLLLTSFILINLQAHSQDPNFFIFLCFGQSNMEGQGAIENQDRTVDDRFQVMQAVDCSNTGRIKGNWYTAVPPLTRCWNGLSPADYFGRTLVENLPSHVRIGVINVSVGGCRIELFDKDIYQDYTDTYSEDWFQDIISTYEGNPYQYLIDLAKNAQKDGVIKGILLHQGESNSSDTQWPEKVKKIYNHFISDLDLSAASVPLLAGEVVHEDQNGALASMNVIINTLPETLPNSSVISSSGCTAKSDNIHFDANGYRTLGTRYGEKMLELLDYDPNVVLGMDSNLDHKGYALQTSYPNPGTGTIIIPFSIPITAYVSIKLFDLGGNEILTITDKEFGQGNHQVEQDLSKLSSGLYICKMQSGNFQMSRKVVVE